jgi:hypothetical protein
LLRAVNASSARADIPTEISANIKADSFMKHFFSGMNMVTSW